MKVTITAGWWDEKSADGYVRHLKGQEADVAQDIGEWLIKSGAATASGEPVAAKVSRRRPSSEK